MKMFSLPNSIQRSCLFPHQFVQVSPPSTAQFWSSWKQQHHELSQAQLHLEPTLAEPRVSHSLWCLRCTPGHVPGCSHLLPLALLGGDPLQDARLQNLWREAGMSRNDGPCTPSSAAWGCVSPSHTIPHHPTPSLPTITHSCITHCGITQPHSPQQLAAATPWMKMTTPTVRRESPGRSTRLPLNCGCSPTTAAPAALGRPCVCQPELDSPEHASARTNAGE